MKSARMLMVAAVWVVVPLVGCMDFDGMGRMGIVHPFSTTRPAASEGLVNRVDGDTVTPPVAGKSPDAKVDARSERKMPAETTGAAAGGTSGDPQVVALTQRIDSLSGQLATNKTARSDEQTSQEQVKSRGLDPAREQTTSRGLQLDQARQSQPARSAAQAGSGEPGRAGSGEPSRTEACDSSSTNPSLEKPATANVGVDLTAASTAPTRQPPKAATPSAVTAAPALAAPTLQSEITASPTPRAMPTIEPTLHAPAAASPAGVGSNVSVEIVDIRPVVTPVASSTPTTASANQPAQSDRTARASDLGGLIAQLEQSMQQRPPHPEDTLRLRLLYLAAGQDEQAVAPIKDMDPVQAELLAAIVKAISSSRQAMLLPLDSNPAALTAAEELRRLIGQQAGVVIARLALVTKVTSYGDYEAISPARFKAGNEIHAYVYTEVGNFRSEPVDGDRLHTLLAEKVQVFDAAGKIVWERSENKIEDRVRSPRRDFFIPFPIHLPANLAPGDYVLKVTIEDRIGSTTDQQRLSFSIQ